MKRFVFLLALFCGAAKAHAYQDYYGNLYVSPSVWRASNTCSADSLVPIATATINFGGIVIGSTGTDPSRVGLFDGSNNLQLTTMSIVQSMVGTMAGGYGVIFSSGGLRYTNVGGSCISILWQYRRQPDTGR